MSDYIPVELVHNIFTKASPETLLRCTAVCKSWYNFITSSSFISSHLNLSKSNNQNQLLLRFCTNISYRDHNINPLIESEHFYIHHVGNKTFDQIKKWNSPFTSPNPYCTIVGGFNGVFFLSDDAVAYNERFMLWNPSIRKLLILPEANIVYEPDHIPYEHAVGFGFLESTNVYKIVRLVYYEPGEILFPPHVEIYELGSGFWRNVDAGDFPYRVFCHSSQACLKDTVHWIGHQPMDFQAEFDTLIATFDMKTERLGTLMVPNILQTDCRLSVSTFRDSLCLIHSADDNSCHVWVMKEYSVVNSWEKLLSIDALEHGFLKPLYFRKNGEILSAKFSNILNDREPSTLVSYDPEKNVVVDLGVRENAFMFYAGNYVESLVLINGESQESEHVFQPGTIQT